MNHFRGGLVKGSSEPCKTANLSESLHHQLNIYTLAASAANTPDSVS